MKSAFIPASCGVVLTAISAAGFSHWFSVRELVLAYQAKSPLSAPPLSPQPAPILPPPENAKPAPLPPAVAKSPVAPANPASPAVASNPTEEFLRSLVHELKSVKDENRVLLDQVEETNRDVMNLQFRVDTHSTQFRPLPVMNDVRPVEASNDLEPVEGVLPPLDLNNALPER